MAGNGIFFCRNCSEAFAGETNPDFPEYLMPNARKLFRNKDQDFVRIMTLEMRLMFLSLSLGREEVMCVGTSYM